MSGILDRKSRIIDYKLTENGRSQIQSGDIRFEYATVSDKSIIYEKDYNKTLENRFNISSTENYIPLEVDTKHLSKINNEFNLGDTFTKVNGNILNEAKSAAGVNPSITFQDASANFIEKNCLGTSLSNLKIITDKLSLKSSGLNFIDKTINRLDFNFTGRRQILDYPTIKSYFINESNLPSIAFDRRFEDKTSFKKLIPVNSQGNRIYQEDNFKGLENFEQDLDVSVIFKNFNKKIEYKEISNKKELLLKVINMIEKDGNIIRREYEINSIAENDNYVFNLYELNENNDSISKLAIVYLDELYDKESSVIKKVYLVGKIIQTKNENDDFNKMYNLNNVIFKDDNNTGFSVSNYYSFINLFTIVIE